MCIDVRILAVFTSCFISLIAGMAVTDGEEDCDKKSQFWDNDTFSVLADTCKPLAYDEQYCLVDDDKKECMRQRARMHDVESCKCHKNASYSGSLGCLYLEICTFVDPDLKCDNNYMCSLDEDDVISCSAPNLPLYTNHCRRGFIHCSRHENCDPLNYQTKYDDVLRDECRKNLTDAFGTNVTIYFIDQVHFNDSSKGFANIFALILAKGDEDNPCIRNGNQFLDSQNQKWKTVVPILIVFIIVLLLSFGSWKFRQIRIRDNKTWDELLNNTFESLSRNVIHTEESVETVESDPTNGVEVADLIPPGGVQLTSESDRGFETADSAPINGFPITQPPGVNGMSQILVDADRNRGFSYGNSSYAYESRLHPSTSSVGSVFSGYSSKNNPGMVDTSCNGFTEGTSGYSRKNDPGMVDTSCNGFTEGTSGYSSKNDPGMVDTSCNGFTEGTSGYSSKNDPGMVDTLCNGFTEGTVSGYSSKTSSALNGSVGQTSTSGLPTPHPHRPFEDTQLDSIFERAISESSDSHLLPNTVSHQANRQDSLSGLNSRLYSGSEDLDNPTYLL